MPANLSTQETAQQDPALDRILRMSSLFISQHNVSSDSQAVQKNPLIALDTSSSQGLSDDLSLSHLIKALAQDSSQPDYPPQFNLLLVLGKTSTPSPTQVVMGTFFPGMTWNTEPNDTEEKNREQASKLTTSHILFQLQPKFHLLQWTGSRMPLPTDFICLDNEATTDRTNMQSLKAIATDDEVSHASYWIGAPEGTKAGLHIDPHMRVATLRTTTTPNEGGSSGRYESIGAEQDGNGDASLEEEFSFTVSQIAIFKAASGTHVSACSGEILTEKDDPRYGHQVHETRIEGEELAKRIQGFGST